jgi:predicted enzyme involved in methoxymalonyl-ACP biosynthesis
MFKKRGQQEIVGFILIVVLVVLGLMFFMIHNLTKETEIINNDIILGNLLSTVMHYTTGCSIDNNKQEVSGMFRACFLGDSCDNQEKGSCEYLNGELTSILESIFSTESKTEGLILDFYSSNDYGVVGVQGFETIAVGNCNGTSFRAFEEEIAGLDDVYVILKAC